MKNQFVKCISEYFAQDGRRRCNHTSDTPRYWNSEVFLECHDKRWCKPEHNDQEIFVQLRLEMFSAGLSFAAILENFQDENGSIHIPKVLQPYTGFDIIE